MFKKFTIIIFLASILSADYDDGNYDMGQTYYKYLLKPLLGYNGEKFTTAHKKSEWEELFANNATKFKELYGTNPQLIELFQSEKFEKIAPHIKAFGIYYALDSGYIPKCGDDKREEK